MYDLYMAYTIIIDILDQIDYIKERYLFTYKSLSCASPSESYIVEGRNLRYNSH